MEVSQWEQSLELLYNRVYIDLVIDLFNKKLDIPLSKNW